MQWLCACSAHAQSHQVPLLAATHYLNTPKTHTQVVKLEAYVDAHTYLGVCHHNKSILPDAPPSMCKPLYCLWSSKANAYIDMWDRPLQKTTRPPEECDQYVCTFGGVAFAHQDRCYAMLLLILCTCCILDMVCTTHQSSHNSSTLSQHPTPPQARGWAAPPIPG